MYVCMYVLLRNYFGYVLSQFINYLFLIYNVYMCVCVCIYMLSFFFRELQLITVLLLICDSYMS